MASEKDKNYRLRIWAAVVIAGAIVGAAITIMLWCSPCIDDAARGWARTFLATTGGAVVAFLFTSRSNSSGAGGPAGGVVAGTPGGSAEGAAEQQAARR